jgi:long-chain acyl-CoA synthetase
MPMSDISYASVPDMLRDHSTRFADHLALKYRRQGKLQLLNYTQYYERALMVSRGLRKFGIGPGDKVAILSENRAGWVIADMGILILGAVTVPIYPTSTIEQVEYMLKHSEAKFVFVSSKFQYSKLLKMREAIPAVVQVSSFERFLGDAALPVCHFYTLSEIDDPITPEEKKELEVFVDRIKPDDLLTIIYTSGTTGVPKGVMLTHHNALFAAATAAKKAEVITDHDTFLSFLPLSHVLERVVGYYMTIMLGCLLTFADSMEKVPENMVEFKPTIMISVPRLFEKAYSRIFETVHEMSIVKRWIFHRSVAIGKRYVDVRYVKQQKPPLGLRLGYAVGDLLVFKKLRGRLGGSMRAFCSGGAPLDKNINEFFWIIGLPILEGYGLTETSAPVSLNTLRQVRFGSVGTPIDGTEFKVDADGEIMVRGPQITAGYYKDPEATAAALSDGWLRTGDVGRIEDGYIHITDRKKELIITASGKNIAPQPIENELKLDKFISQAFVYGDRKPYLTALVVPNFERIREFAKENHINYFDMDDLVMHEPIEELLEQRIAEVNSRLAKYETIKRFVLLPRDFTVDGGELTPTLKLRRKQIVEKYGERIEDMYAENWHSKTVSS